MMIVAVTRVALSLLFIITGTEKILQPASMAALFKSLGLPAQTTLLVGAFELVLGVAFAAGFRQRWVAAVLAPYCIFTALIGHQFWADPTQLPDFLKNVGLAGAFLLFAIPGLIDQQTESR